MMRILFQTQCPVKMPAVFLLICFTCFACTGRSYTTPAGYDINEPDTRELGKSVNEISGLTFNASDSSLLAISDSKRKIFQIDLYREKLRDYAEKMYTQSDFEDIVKIDTTIYVLISDGTIISMPPNVADSSRTTVYPTPFRGKNDFETMYYDPEANGLVIICKECEEEKGQHRRTAYRFDLNEKVFDDEAFYEISTTDIKAILKNDDANFRPSAAAIHPKNNNLYIISSAGSLFVIADKKGKVLEAYNINPDIYPQPEGLAFAGDGTMFISNEGKYGKPTLLIFPFNKEKDPSKQNK